MKKLLRKRRTARLESNFIRQLYVILALSLYLNNLNAQTFDYSTICGGVQPSSNKNIATTNQICSNASLDYVNKYSKQSFYIPTANDPVITIKITFHVIANSDGSINPWPGTAGINALQLCGNTYLHNWKERYSDQRVANYSTPFSCDNPYIQDTKINYELTNIYYYNDDAMNTSTDGSLIGNLITSKGANRLNEGVPIVFNNGALNGASGFAQSFNGHAGIQSFVNYNGNDAWFLQEHIKHEMGHVLGLYHTYNVISSTGDELQFGFNCTHPDFLCDVFPINNNNCSNGSLPCNMCFELGPNNLESNNLMGGRHNGWTSPLQMGRMRRHLHLPFNGTRNYVKEMISDFANPWLITSNEIWDFDIQMYKDIIVKSGSTLTIKCKVGMANNGRIIVERGARLIIDGGEVYPWGSNWSGIQVWGTSNKRQSFTAAGLSTDHGVVNIINQGTVREANDGITTGKYDENGNLDFGGYMGGIVRCNNAKFINCWRAIQYLSYHNFNPTNGNTIDNIGYVYNSTFETNSIRKDPNTPYPSVFISLWDVQGIKFYGNSYKNTINPIPSIENRGDGIYSIDASYYIDKYKVCRIISPNGCGSYSANNPSTFTNLHYGVHVQNSTPLTNIKINDNDFIGCNRAIYIGGTYNTSITNNRINVGNGTTDQNYIPYGIYSEFSSAYDISNNNITTTQTTNYNTSVAVGICINGNGSIGVGNTLYRNTINMMSTGTTIYGDNQGTNPGEGLQLRCNNYGQGANGKNFIDMYMGEQVNSPTAWRNGRIDKFQGSSTLGANNLFSHTNNSAVYVKTDFHDKGPGPNNSSNPPNSFEYYFNPTGGQLTQPLYYNTSLHVNTPNVINLNIGSMCPVSLSNLYGSGTSLGRSIATTKTIIATNTNSISTLLAKIDGGQTQQLLNTINSNLSNGNLKDLLEQKSPYLSDTVLIAYFGKITTPPGHLKDIHDKNKPVNQKVWAAILNRNLPNGIMKDLNEQQSVKKINELNKLLGQVADLNQQKGFEVDETIRQLLSDTLNGWNKDSIIDLMKADNRYESECRLLSAYVALDKLTEAQMQVTTIKNANSGSLDDFCKIQELIMQLKQQGKTIHAIKTDVMKRMELEQIESTKTDAGYTNAQAILSKVFNYKYFEYISLPNTFGSSARMFKTDETTHTLESITKLFNLYPNPSNGNAFVTYASTIKYTQADIIVIDITGKKVIEQKLNANDNVHTIYTQNLTTGMYLVCLVLDGNIIEKQKLIKE